MVKLFVTLGIVALAAIVIWAVTSRWNWRPPRRWRRSVFRSRRQAAHEQALRDIDRLEQDLDEGRN